MNRSKSEEPDLIEEINDKIAEKKSDIARREAYFRKSRQTFLPCLLSLILRRDW